MTKARLFELVRGYGESCVWLSLYDLRDWFHYYYY